MNISKYNDIELNKNGYSYIMKYCSANIDVEYDWFDYHVSTGGSADIYDIEKQNSVVGYVALYDYDCTNRSVYLYGKVSERQYFGDLLKAILSVMDYAFTSLNVNKINFVYREDKVLLGKSIQKFFILS